MIREIHAHSVLVFGCGNTLFGDDGFGPAVVGRLHRDASIPDHVHVEDVGTSISDLLFDLSLSPEKPEMICIVDAVDVQGRQAGEVFEISPAELPRVKRPDFSMHQFPSINLLQELQDQAGVIVRILAVQISCIPEEVRPGLSEPVQAALGRACDWIEREIFTHQSPFNGLRR
jgi:coenzyme F420 hydrogenase subunit delta